MRVSELERLFDYSYWANRRLFSGERLKPEDFPSAEFLINAWSWVEDDLRAFLAELEEGDLAREIVFAIGNGPKQSLPLGDLLHHAALHAVHHRGQVALLLRELGVVPGNFDLLIYAWDQRVAHV